MTRQSEEQKGAGAELNSFQKTLGPFSAATVGSELPNGCTPRGRDVRSASSDRPDVGSFRA